jgi:hypothetical protein
MIPPEAHFIFQKPKFDIHVITIARKECEWNEWGRERMTMTFGQFRRHVKPATISRVYKKSDLIRPNPAYSEQKNFYFNGSRPTGGGKN